MDIRYVLPVKGISWIAIISILFIIIPGVYFIIKYGYFCLQKCFCPMLQTLPETIAECFCCETETATHNRSNSSENVRDEPPPETTTEANGSLSISGSMISLNVLAEEPLIPSLTGTGNAWEPPPYAAITPIPPETMIEAPPTYYDVMTHGD